MIAFRPRIDPPSPRQPPARLAPVVAFGTQGGVLDSPGGPFPVAECAIVGRNAPPGLRSPPRPPLRLRRRWWRPAGERRRPNLHVGPSGHGLDRGPRPRRAGRLGIRGL